jgi:N-alpha-acetyltransferase 50
MSAMEGLQNHPDIVEIYLHVQTSNSDAIGFYAKHGFETKDMIKDYYKRIEPPDCYILSKRLDIADGPGPAH